MQMIRKPLSILLALVMILSVFTIVPVVSAGAAETIAYVNAAGEDMGTQSCTPVTQNDTEWSDGWYAVTLYRTNANVIEISGTVNLILCDNVQYNAYKGIVLKPGSHLIIWGQSGGTGKLFADGDPGHAGIGGGDGETGSLTINGGKIDAYGGKGAAALGSATGDSGIITINGGSVSAKGSDAYVDSAGASGIGTGSGSMNNIYFTAVPRPRSAVIIVKPIVIILRSAPAPAPVIPAASTLPLAWR